jgi:Ca2+-binding EF-hand superfamily protein
MRGKQLAEHEAENIICQYDSEMKGYISLDDFKTMFKKPGNTTGEVPSSQA